MSEYQPSPIIEVQDTSHANGAATIQEIRISTSQWNRTYEEYSLLLGIEPAVTLGQNGRSCLFPIQSTSIHLVENQKDGIDHIILSCDRQIENGEILPPLHRLFFLLDTVNNVYGHLYPNRHIEFAGIYRN